MNEKEIVLAEPHPGQEKILSEARRFNVLCCGRRFGKSALAVNLIAERAVEGFPVGYFTPTYRLLDGTFKECLRVLEPIIKRSNDHKFIELITGGIIDFWSLENEMAGRSRKYKRAICDEVAYAKDLWRSWTEAIRATLTDMRGDAWFMSTPRGKNDFYKIFKRGQSGEEQWISWQMPTAANPYIHPDEIEDARRDLPELAFSQEYLAEFNDNVANPFGLSYIEQCTYPISGLPAVCYGVDLAKSFDYTVIIGLDRNGSVCHFERFQHDWRQTVQVLVNLPNVPIAIDSTGVGDPIGEEVARHKSVELVQFTSRTKQQLMEGLAVAIQQRRITFPPGKIAEELSDFEYEYGRTGVKYAAPPGLHDDCVCSLALAWRKYQAIGPGGAEISFI